MKRAVGIAAILAAGLIARVAVRDFVSFDARFWVAPWYQFIHDHGVKALGEPLPNSRAYVYDQRWKQDPRPPYDEDSWTSEAPPYYYGETTGNYPPPYYYLLYVAGWFDDWLPRLYLIKLVSIAFDVVAALFAFLLVRAVSGSVSRALAAGAAVFAAPTLIANGALWGQCDAIPASLMLASAYFAVVKRARAAMVTIGIALSFKAQAVFLVPFLLMLTVRGRIPVLEWLWVPLTYAAMMTPAALLGRDYSELLLTYARQGGFFGHLSMMAPNLYYFVPDAYYRIGTIAGTLVTVATSGVYAVLPRRWSTALRGDWLVLAATTSVAIAPFLLPKMHDRYFLAADLLSIVLAFCIPRFWPVAVGFQVSSLCAYLPMITNALNEYEGGWTDQMPVAIAINSVLIALLFVSYVRKGMAPGMTTVTPVASAVRP